MNVDSVGSSEYFVTFIDDYLRFITVYMIKQKSEVFEKFKKFINFDENQMGHKVKGFSCENERKRIKMSQIN